MRQNKTFRLAPPKAGAMIEALRGIGYSTATALADIIDNSITAESQNIEVTFHWDGINSKISVLDDGKGMNARELDLAMRLGEKNPLEQREQGDLGRFGLGLKTASFSQCKRLTVASKKNGTVNALYWDLEEIEKDVEDRWLLLEGIPSSLSDLIPKKFEMSEAGTLVYWEVLDRVVTPEFNEQNFLDLIDSVESHLAMVFHRFLDGSYGNLSLLINSYKIAPWNPFMEGNASKPWHSPSAKHPFDKEVEIECHVLPHQDRLTQDQYLRYQGPDGWTAQQGFYVYRGGRMVVSGDWLGLGRGRLWTKDEAHRLARIRVDIPVSSDSDWKIDIKKASARPPVKLRDWLVQMAELTRHRARKAFAHRGHVASRNKNDKEVIQTWCSTKTNEGVKYRINYNHPSVRSVLDNAGDLLPAIKTMLKIVQETVPIQRIWLDTEEQKETPRNRFNSQPPEELKQVLSSLFSAMTNYQGFSEVAAVEQLKRTDPFQDFPDIVEGLLNKENGGECDDE